MDNFSTFFIVYNIVLGPCLPLTSSSRPTHHIGSQRWRLSETVRSDCFILVAILQLHSSSGHVTSDPGGDILTNLDHDEKDDPVDDYHA